MKVCYSILLVLLSLVAGAQTDLVSTLHAEQIGNQIRIDLVIASGISYCTGIDLERSSDGENFDKIDAIAGVCGGSEFEEAYSLFDESPIPNQVNYYRLNLLTSGRSEILIVFFVPYENGIITFPNPAANLVQFKFDNPQNSQFECLLYQNGKKVFHSPKSSGNEYSVNTDLLLPGLYTFEIVFESGKKLIGKVILAKN